MDKQELITRIKCLDEPYLKMELILDLIKQLNEPEKPVVPQFVADWIFKAQSVNDFSLCIALEHTTIKLYANNSEEILKWLEIRKNQETFALAWVNGYEVEKEKRYIVKVKRVEKGYDYLNHRISLDSWFFSGESEPLDFRTKHTRKQLEDADFGWVFDCPGIEIEEVEE